MFDFRFWPFDFCLCRWSSRTFFYIIFMCLTHLDTWFDLISISNFDFFELSKMWYFIFQFFWLFLTLLLTISKIESVKLKYVIIAKMNLKVIENGLQKMLEALEHPLESPRNFEAEERGECCAPRFVIISKKYPHWRHEDTPNLGALHFGNGGGVRSTL